MTFHGVASKRFLLLAPNVLGNDGIATVTRQATGCWSGEESSRLEVWSLLDGEIPEFARRRAATYRTAGRNRRRFMSWGVRAGLSGQGATTVLAMHMALAPVALPLVMRGAKLAVFLHGVEAWRPVRRAESMALRQASLLVANSEHTVRGFKAANPRFADRQIVVCPLGTEIQVSESPPADRATHSIRPFALIVGRMSAEERYKGHDLLIDLWPSIVNQIPDATLIVAGDGDDRKRLEVKASNASNRIRFVGRISDEELRRLYRECDFFVMPSCGEGFGLVFLEAMRAGRACLGGTGAAAEVIEHGVTGYVVDPSDADAVRGAIVQLFSDREQTKRMGDAGAKRVAAHFTADHFRRRLRTILDSLESQEGRR